ncbi:MAG: hypothetical protein JWN70_5923 [Planctomycetaceae bacterium]|nr:hypothetical protein [Planctomycetaceae bacterium]
MRESVGVASRSDLRLWRSSQMTVAARCFGQLPQLEVPLSVHFSAP